MTEKVFKYIEEHEEEYIQLLRETVALESYTPDKDDVTAVASHLKAFCESKGLNVFVKEFEKAGNGLLITFNEDASLPAVAFTGHTDTVHPKAHSRSPFSVKKATSFTVPALWI